MKKLFLILLMLVMLSACSHQSVYWRETRKTGIERLQWNRAAWPRHHGCSTYYTSQPVKYSTMRNLYFNSHAKRQ